MMDTHGSQGRSQVAEANGASVTVDAAGAQATVTVASAVAGTISVGCA